MSRAGRGKRTKGEIFAPGPKGAIYFLVADKSTEICSYTWRIWWGRTSFYVKPAYTPFAEMKVSLHGDDQVIKNPMLKFDIDRGATRTVEELGGIYKDFVNLPILFTGKSTDRADARLVMRIRNTWDLFQQGMESAPLTSIPKEADVGSVASAPPPGYATDLVIFVSTNAPYWPREAEAKQRRAALGPIRNKAGEYLTGLIVRQPTITSPPPEGSLQPATPGGTRRRGLGFRADSDGVLWITEQMVRIE